MADILIRGIDAPESCLECGMTYSFFRNLHCNKLEGMSGFVGPLPHANDRHPDCPLLPLPEGHGDLIDRDAFRAENGLNAKCEHCPTNTYECQRDMIHTKMEFCGMLDDAPVIVPAEGGEADGNS